MKYLGLMSGTSADGIDAVLISLPDSQSVQMLATAHSRYSESIRNEIAVLRAHNGSAVPAAKAVQQLGELDTAIGDAFADAAINLLKQTGTAPSEVRAIGSHGQTIRHDPRGSHPFSLQLGNAAIIAERTGITTVANFRARDIAAGGHGAPLVPAFHNLAFRTMKADRAIVNVGGIANITLLPADPTAAVLGFDSGPGNTLLDTWIEHQLNKAYDEDGRWAASGNPHHELLERFRSDPYFKTAPPKSTGQETFNLSWIEEGLRHLRHMPRPEDVQATLAVLTAETIVEALGTLTPAPSDVYLCGGGTHNHYLVELVGTRLGKVLVGTTAKLGIDPDWVEAVAFAWLAHCALEGMPGNLPSVTGARHPAILGAIHKA